MTFSHEAVAMEAKIPMITMTVRTSARVKPHSDLLTLPLAPPLTIILKILDYHLPHTDRSIYTEYRMRDALFDTTLIFFGTLPKKL
jgi:hypothetical protein